MHAFDHSNSSFALVNCSKSGSLELLTQEIDSVVLGHWQESHEAGLVVRSYFQIHLPFDLGSFLGSEL